MTDSITLAEDLIDTRDLIERLEELESEWEDFMEDKPVDFDDFEQFDDYAELELLREAADILENEPDYHHGVCLINQDYFQTHARELAEDIGALGENSDWIATDWNQTAETLLTDYTTHTFSNGETYHWR